MLQMHMTSILKRVVSMHRHIYTRQNKVLSARLACLVSDTLSEYGQIFSCLNLIEFSIQLFCCLFSFSLLAHVGCHLQSTVTWLLNLSVIYFNVLCGLNYYSNLFAPACKHCSMPMQCSRNLVLLGCWCSCCHSCRHKEEILSSSGLLWHHWNNAGHHHGHQPM